MDIVFQSGEEFNNISGKRKTKMSFCFALRSLIRTFAGKIWSRT
jgi:hypothetical protein